MTGKQFRFCLACLLLWPAGAFVSDRILDVISPLVWACFHQADATRLTRGQFSLAAYLPLALVTGSVLGLIPVHQLRLIGRAVMGRLKHQPEPTPVSEIARDRPVLWAWVLPTALFCLRWITFGMGADHSVLGGRFSVGRFEHFFGRFNAQDLATADPSAVTAWLHDRIFLTEPILFLAAYSAGVWIRHRVRMPEHAVDNSTDTLGS